MKLATLKSRKSRDGELIVVSRDNKTFVRAGDIAPSLREAVEDWARTKPLLETVYQSLCEGQLSDAEPVKLEELHSPFPRSFQWADGSAFLQHVKLVRKARNA
jgi:fumarylacetoacetate (FAA) hydrolase